MNRFESRSAEQLGYFPPTKSHVPNPGMGIMSMLLSDHMINIHAPELRGSKRPFDDAHRLPPVYPTFDEMLAAAKYQFTDNLYIRVGWRDVQTTRGRLDLSPKFEEALEAVRQSGKSWSLRVMQCSPSNPEKSLIPDFAREIPTLELADEGFPGGGRLMPLYSDEFFALWSELTELLGERFDADPALSYVDLSGFGFWGEGHHAGPQMRGIDDSVIGNHEKFNICVEKFINMYNFAFKKTPIVINAHHCEYESGRKALENGAWLRRDSYFNWFKASEAEWGLLRRPDAAVVTETIIPLENRPENAKIDNHYQNFLELPDLKCDWGCHFAAIGFNPADTLYAAERYPELFTDFSRRIGYRIRLSIVWLTRSGERKWLTLGLVNDGCVGLPGKLTLTARCAGISSSVELTDEENYNLCGHMTIVDIPFDGASGEVKITASLKMKGKTLPVRFATICADGDAPYELTLKINK